jgi:hypothetical protein
VLCFIDNDIILKFAACNLLDEVLIALNCERKHVRVSPTAIHKFRKRNSKLVADYGEDGVRRAIAFVSSVTPINETNTEEQLLLNEVDKIDEGEAILFATTANVQAFVLTTGDKNCLRALAQNSICQPICARLKGKVICFEQVFLRVINHSDFETVKAHVLPALECDKVLKTAFGLGEETTITNARAAFQHYANNLRKEMGKLLINDDTDE